jgi:crotonobetainyl-CoA:carnitine CoA-transferase CaiB-like acyl-CoA transferase
VAEPSWRQPLTEAWAAIAGPAQPPAARLDVSGDPGHLPSRLAVEDTAVACAGTALLAAAALHERRGGPRPSTARLDRAQLAAAFRSERYLRITGKPVADGFAPLSRFWPAADGWVRTHANYPWHQEALLRALVAPGDPDAVAAAIARANARDLEDLIVAAGGVAAAVRTERDWRTEPQGEAASAAALVTGGRIGAAPPRHRTPGALPASGIRVLDLTRVISGPVCTRYLAALGADVLRIDPPHRPELPLHAVDGLLGKRSAVLDLGAHDGLGTLHELLGQADVLVHGYRPHALDRFGLAPEALAERHPGLVIVSLSAWGEAGPWGERRGFDSIVQAASGIAMAESPDGERPGAMPCQLLDHGTGYLCAAAALASLAAQMTDGGTHARSFSLIRTSLWLLGQSRATSQVQAPASVHEPPLSVVDSPDGPVTVVDPPGELDGVPLRWSRPLSRYGADQPVWSGTSVR